MRKEDRGNFIIAADVLAAFLGWTAAVRWIDVEAIGPQGSAVGVASINQFVHRLTGVHMFLYTVTDWLSLVPVMLGTGFAFLGLMQWIRRRRLLSVDYSLLVLGGFYIAVMAAYILFEAAVVNYRPVLIDGILEASYPSSTTMLVMCVIPTSIMQFRDRIQNRMIRRCVVTACAVFMVFMVIGRLVSGVHWLTDIIGGALLSAGLVLMYRAVIRLRIG
ncbi:MAG: phosphatase PAP2 family protein [Clostridia bacterium]|nr:phosphatase PAP2 family protein [Clostridia bacterium]